MRYLGIDYGTKRTGVAISGPNGRVAVVKETIESSGEKEVIDRIDHIIAQEEVDAVVVGMPQGLSGEQTPMTERVQRFVNALALNCDVPVYTMDERLTSSMAEGLTREHKKAQTDQVAAQILLQDYLDRQV